MKQKTDSEQLDDLLDTAKDLFEKADSGWRDIRQTSNEDLQFYHGKQWDDQLLNIARLKKEPALQVNRLPQFVKQIENELRQREMAITVNASDEEGSDETANIFSGIIRAIEHKSNAKLHYIHAAGENGALVPGIGYLKVEVDYENSQGFNQDIKITSVKDPSKVICDPMVQEADFSDAEYWFEFEDYAEKTFKKNFPRAECSSVEMFPAGSHGSTWIGDKTIRVARMWYKEYTSITTFLMDDGSIEVEENVEPLSEDDADDAEIQRKVMVKGQKKTILRDRVVTDCVIKWVDFSGAEVLNEGVWAGKFFPFVAVTGPMSIIDGKRDIRGIIRFAKDSQKMLNYMASSAARRIAAANKSPWIVDMKSIAPYKEAWRRSNTDSQPFLPYDAYDVNANGRQNPVPTRADQTGQIQDLLEAAAKFENDLKATIGIYDAGLGATPNEQSGVAIKTLAQQGQNANFHFSENLVAAIKTMGALLIDLVPKIYDAPRMVKMVSVDGQQRLVKINEITQAKGKQVIYNIADAVGHYGVTVDVGPGYATQKQAAIEQMTSLMKINPQIAPYVQDIIAGNMDFEGKDIVRDRLVKLLASTAPGIVENPDQADIPPQAMAAMQQQQAMIQQLTQQLQELGVEYEKLQFTLASKQVDHQQAIEKAKVDAQLASELQSQKQADAMEIEQARAIREAALNEQEANIQAVKTQLSHTEKMMSVVIESMKLFGANGAQAVAEVLPAVDAMADNAMATS